MATLSIRLPDSLHRHLKDLAKKEKVSINQLVSTAALPPCQHAQQVSQGFRVCE